MKPQLGDTISNRYVLVSPLREETGLQVWKASDHVLARDCQLFIVSSSKALQEVNATASMLLFRMIPTSRKCCSSSMPARSRWW